MIIIKNKFGNVFFDLSEKHIILKFSGGFDSAILLYVLASEIHKNNLDITIHPITIKKIGNEKNLPKLDKFDPENNIKNLINFVKEQFPAVKISDPEFGTVDEWWLKGNEKASVYALNSLLKKVHKSLHVKHVFDYSGVTKNPDIVIGEEFFNELDENGNEIIVHRNPEKHRDEIVNSFVENTVSVLIKENSITRVEPFRNMDKRITISLAADYGILDFLLKNTRSCEGRRGRTNNFTTTCTEEFRCWWCHEREWALNNYDK